MTNDKEREILPDGWNENAHQIAPSIVIAHAESNGMTKAICATLKKLNCNNEIRLRENIQNVGTNWNRSQYEKVYAEPVGIGHRKHGPSEMRSSRIIWFILKRVARWLVDQMIKWTFHSLRCSCARFIGFPILLARKSIDFFSNLRNQRIVYTVNTSDNSARRIFNEPEQMRWICLCRSVTRRKSDKLRQKQVISTEIWRVCMHS